MNFSVSEALGANTSHQLHRASDSAAVLGLANRDSCLGLQVLSAAAFRILEVATAYKPNCIGRLLSWLEGPMWSEQPCDATCGADEDARILIIAVEDLAVRLAAIVQHLNGRVVVASTHKSLRQLLAIENRWTLVMVAGDLPSTSCKELAAQLWSRRTAKVVCAMPADHARDAWIVRMVESMLARRTPAVPFEPTSKPAQLRLYERNRTLT